MGKDCRPLRRCTLAPPQLLAVIGTLAVVLTVPAVLIFRLRGSEAPPTPNCLQDSRTESYARPQSFGEFQAGAMQCGREPHADEDWMQGPEGQKGGTHTCLGYENVCLDQGALVTHDERYNMVNGSELPTFDVTTLM